VPACRKKWDKVQLTKDPSERRPCPEEPKEFQNSLAGAKDGTIDF
jgi:hypothetical protein